jgi:hypothetical protein
MAAVERSKSTWDFSGVAGELEELALAIQRDGTLVDLTKRPMINVINVSLKALEERHRSPQHLFEALKSAHSRMPTLTLAEAKYLTGWFFRVAYSGGAVTFEIEQLARPILALIQGDAGANKKRLSGDLDKYHRLAQWGVDLGLSERNVRGLLIASRVLALPKGFSDEAVERAKQTLEVLKQRSGLTIGELVRGSLSRCHNLISPIWDAFKGDGRSFLSQPDTVALHVCLNSILKIVLDTEALADEAHEMTAQVNILRSRFQQIRYPSSTTLLTRMKSDLDQLAQVANSSIDFDDLRSRVREIQERANTCRSGKRGINWMHSDHVAEALSIASDIYHKIRDKERDSARFVEEIKRIEESIIVLENASLCPTAGQLKRVMAKLKRDSLLSKWIPLCFQAPTERQTAFEKLAALRTKGVGLWQRMESEEPLRLNDFRKHCIQIRSELAVANDLNSILSEIVELTRCRDDFSKNGKLVIEQEVDALFSAFRSRVTDINALEQHFSAFAEEIARAHRRIFAPIDFDELHTRASALKRWVLLRDFPSQHRTAMLGRANRCFAEIRKIKFRHEKAIADRAAKADHLASELSLEIQDTIAEARQRPADPQVWQTLVSLDGRSREAWKFLKEDQRESFRMLVDEGFQIIRDARARFAAEASRVFSEYNEVLSNALFLLEEEPTRETAFEVIERIKPIRTALRTEKRLLRTHHQELNGSLSVISASIDELFERAAAQATEEEHRIFADIEKFEAEIAEANDWVAANELINAHKQLSADLRETKLSIAVRKSCRTELDRLWDELADRLRLLRARRETEDIGTVMAALERRGYIQIVSSVPAIS